MSLEPLTLDQPIPHVCKVADVCRVLQISRSTFDRLMADGKLPLVELDKLDRHRRFKGESVAAIKRGKWAPKGK